MNKINLIELISSVFKENKIKENSELHIQKIIFFAYGLFFQKFKKKLIENLDFKAWKYGIIEMNYRHYFRLKQDEFKNKYDAFVTDDEKMYLLKIINVLVNKSPWLLVELSHNSYAWYANYNIDDCNVNDNDIKKSFQNITIDL